MSRNPKGKPAAFLRSFARETLSRDEQMRSHWKQWEKVGEMSRVFDHLDLPEGVSYVLVSHSPSPLLLKVERWGDHRDVELVPCLSASAVSWNAPGQPERTP